jgi:hypothetical protein
VAEEEEADGGEAAEEEIEEEAKGKGEEGNEQGDPTWVDRISGDGEYQRSGGDEGEEVVQSLSSELQRRAGRGATAWEIREAIDKILRRRGKK